MILARFSRSDSACLAIARCISVRQVHGLHRHLRHLDAPGIGVLVDDLLQHGGQALALGEQLVEVGLAQDAAQRGLGHLAGGVEVVLDLHDGLHRVDARGSRRPRSPSRVTLSLVITSWGGTSSTTVRRLTRTMRSMGQATIDEARALGRRAAACPGGRRRRARTRSGPSRTAAARRRRRTTMTTGLHHAPFRTRSVSPSTAGHA